MGRMFISGVSTGLGLALAQTCLADGHELWAMGRSEPVEVSSSERFHFVSQDLREFEAIPAAVATLLKDCPGLDCAILNSGALGDIKDLASTSQDEIRFVMDLNVWSNKWLIDALIASPVSVAQIVGMSSGAAINGSGGWGPYSISKAALNLLFQVYAEEQPKTHFCALAPGVVYTQMIQTIADTRPIDERFSASGRIREALAGGQVMEPAVAARRYLDAVQVVRNLPSGTFADVRKLDT